jgi:hypothetical protein
MDYKLDKLVGRDPLPRDKIAFDRVTRLFARAREVPVATKRLTVSTQNDKKAGAGKKLK